MIRFNRTTLLFEEWSGTAWAVKLLSVAGGGTGAATAAAARTNLGLGSMSTQNDNAVAISAGSATLTTLNVTGAVDFAGGAQFGTGNVNLVDSTGRVPGITSVYFTSLDGSVITGLAAGNLASGTVPLARLAGITNVEIAAGAGIVYSKLALAGTIVNADVAALAAIAYSKLSLGGSIVNADVAAAAAIAWSKLDKAGSSLLDLATRSAADLASGTLPLARLSGITNAEISATAAIAYSKLSLATSIVNGDVAAAAAIAWTKLDKGGSSLADLVTRSAADLSSGTIPLARISGLTDAEVAAAAAIAWSKISKVTSSLGDLATRSAGDIASGTLGDARLSANVDLLNLTATYTAIKSNSAQPRGKVYRIANQSIANATETKVTFSAITDNVGVSGPPGTPDDLQTTTAGGYLVIAQVTFANNGTGIRKLLIKNQTTTVARCEATPHGTDYTTLSCSALVITAVDNHLMACVYQNSGAALDIYADGNANNTVLWAVKLW